MHVDPGFFAVDPTLAFRDFQPLKLKHDKPLSSFAFNCNLRPYTKSLLTRNGFISAVERMDTQSLEALLPTVDRIVVQVREVQVEAAADIFDDLVRRLEALNASAVSASPAPAELISFLAVGTALH